MDTQLYLRVRGRVLGPYDQEKLQSLVRRGQLSRMHEVSTDGTHWVQAGTYPELFVAGALVPKVAPLATPPLPPGMPPSPPTYAVENAPDVLDPTPSSESGIQSGGSKSGAVRSVTAIKKTRANPSLIFGGVIIGLIAVVVGVGALAVLSGYYVPGKKTAASAPTKPSASNPFVFPPQPGSQRNKSSPPDEAEGIFAFTGCCATCLAVVVGWIVLNIMLLIWVASDAKARGMSGAAWLFLIFLFGPLPLIIYIFARPQGRIVRCPTCSNKRLAVSAVCPHCGNA